QPALGPPALLRLPAAAGLDGRVGGHPQQLDAEEAAGVGPDAVDLEARGARQGAEVLQLVLVRALGVDRLAAREGEAAAGERDDLIAAAHQVHLDPALAAVPERAVIEGGDVEVGAELAVDAVQQVAVELGRDTERVVGGRLEDGARLAQVDADQERAAGAALPRALAHALAP